MIALRATVPTLKKLSRACWPKPWRRAAPSVLSDSTRPAPACSRSLLLSTVLPFSETADGNRQGRVQAHTPNRSIVAETILRLRRMIAREDYFNVVFVE